MPEASPLIPSRDRDLRAVLLCVAALTAARLVALFATPLQLYPDEAQYWLWSRTLDFGYYSKPPMIAWAIWATTAMGGDAEAWVRLSASLFQAGATVVVFLIGRRVRFGASAPRGDEYPLSPFNCVFPPASMAASRVHRTTLLAIPALQLARPSSRRSAAPSDVTAQRVRHRCFR